MNLTFSSCSFHPRWVLVPALFFALVSAFPPLVAQERLTSATLSSWTLSGAASQVDAVTGVITLPSGGQMARVFSDYRIEVRLVSRPYFSETREGWPAVEIGPASLSFVRDPNGGGIVLLGDEALQLPDAIALDQNGRSVRELDLRFSYDRMGGEALLAFDGTLFPVAVRSQADSVEVVFSAGAESDWAIETLDVEATSSVFEDSGVDDAPPSSTESDGATSAAEVPAAPQGIDSRVIDAVVVKIEAGDLEGAADLLGNATATKGTLTWYQMAAMVLVGRTEELKAAGEYRAFRRIASAAVTLLEHGLKVAGEVAQPGERAEVLALNAYVREDHLGARTLARLNYQRALEELPQHEGAKEALARFDEEDRKAQRIQLRGDGQ